jgi:hypothetical protein
MAHPPASELTRDHAPSLRAKAFGSSLALCPLLQRSNRGTQTPGMTAWVVRSSVPMVGRARRLPRRSCQQEERDEPSANKKQTSGPELYQVRPCLVSESFSLTLITSMLR